MAYFTLTNRAKADMKEIGLYTQAKWGSEQRVKYLTALDESFHRAARNALALTEASHIRQGYKMYHVGRHVVFFRQKSRGGIEIVRILHERMEMKRHLVSP